MRIRSRLQRSLGSPTRQGLASTVLAGAFAQGMTLISGILAARLLGVEGRGLLALWLLLPVIAAKAGEWGSLKSTTYFVAQQPRAGWSGVRQMWPFGTLQLLFTGALAGGLVWAYRDKIGEVPRVFAAVVLATAIWILVRHLALSALIGLERYRAYALWAVGPTTLYAIGLLVLFGTDTASPKLVFLIWTGATIGVGAGALLWAGWELRRAAAPSAAPAASRRQWIAFGLKGWFATLAPVSSFRLDQVVVSVWLTAHDMGLYVAAYAFTNLSRVISHGVGLVALPSISRRRRAAPAESAGLMWRFLWLALATNAAIAVGLALAMPWLLPLLFGAAFAPAVPTAVVLVAATAVLGVRQVVAEAVQGMGRPMLATQAELLMYPWFLLSVPWLVPERGILAVAWIQLVGYAISCTYLVWTGSRIARREAASPPDPVSWGSR